MSYWWRVLVVVLASLAALFLVPIAICLAKRKPDAPALMVGGSAPSIEAWRLPKWAAWLETQDDRDGLLPGGLYEPAIFEVYRAKGWRAASRAWLLRNKAYRLSKILGPSIPKPVAPMSGHEAKARWATLLRGEPLILDSLDGRHVIAMWMKGNADPELGIQGTWEGHISYEICGGNGDDRVNVWCKRRVFPMFFGRSPWIQRGWKLDPYFDAVRDFSEVNWPSAKSAAGMVTVPWVRFERSK